MAQLRTGVWRLLRRRRTVSSSSMNAKYRMVNGTIARENRYAVAVREGADLWLALWVKRSATGEFFLFRPTADRHRNTHTSYHLDGTRHMKSRGRKFLRHRFQPLNGPFHGTVDLGIESGYSPKSVGTICDPSAFSGVVEVPPGILGPRYGAVGVVLIAPDQSLPDYTWGYAVVAQTVFRDVIPNVVITILRNKPFQVY